MNRTPNQHSSSSSGTRLDTERLLDRPLPDGALEEAARLLATPEVVTSRDTASLFVFRLGGEWFGLPCGVIEEITDYRKAHSLPHRRSALVEGVVNIRGRLVVCVSLAQLLGVAGSASEALSLPRLVVLRREERRLALAVAHAHGVETYDPAAVIQPPATLEMAARTFTTGIISLCGLTVACLDADLLFAGLTEGMS
jgi:chemotaxis signal transduction protein